MKSEKWIQEPPSYGVNYEIANKDEVWIFFTYLTGIGYVNWKLKIPSIDYRPPWLKIIEKKKHKIFSPKRSTYMQEKSHCLHNDGRIIQHDL